MNPNIQQAGPPVRESNGIPPPYGGGTRRAALMANSFGAANFQAFLDQAGTIAQPMELPEEESAAPEPKSASRPLSEGRPLAMLPQEELIPVTPDTPTPSEESLNLHNDSGLATPTVRETQPADPQEQAALEPVQKEEPPVILWTPLASMDPRVAMQALKGMEGGTTGPGKGNTPLNLEQMLAHVRGNQPGGQLQNSFAAESLTRPATQEGPLDPALLNAAQTTGDVPVDEAMLKNMLQDPALTTVNRLVTPQTPSVSALPPGETPSLNGMAAQVSGIQFSNNAASDGSGNQQGMGNWGGPGQTGAVGGKSHSTGQPGQTLSANSPHFADELANRVGRMRLISRPGMSDQVKITLDPKDLGELNMRLHLDDENRVHLMISAESEATKEMLNRQMSQLKEALAKQNLGFGEVMVEVSTQEKGSQGQGFARQGEREGTGYSDYREQTLTEPDLKPGERVIFRSDSSGVNVIA